MAAATEADAWADRIGEAHRAAAAAKTAEEQVIRDASAAGMNPTEIAAALGTRNRQRVYAILRAAAGEPDRPVPVPVVYLRGRGMNTAAWERVQRAMWRRGLVTTRDRSDAWRLARSNVPVVLCDFSEELDDNPPAHGGGFWHGYDRYVRVGLVRARYRVTKYRPLLKEMLGPVQEARFREDGAAQLLTIELEEREDREEELILVNGGKDYRPWAGTGHLDEDALARLVLTALGRDEDGRADREP
jgi:hypothetical protein